MWGTVGWAAWLKLQQAWKTELLRSPPSRCVQVCICVRVGVEFPVLPSPLLPSLCISRVGGRCAWLSMYGSGSNGSLPDFTDLGGSFLEKVFLASPVETARVPSLRRPIPPSPHPALAFPMAHTLCVCGLLHTLAPRERCSGTAPGDSYVVTHSMEGGRLCAD